MSEASLELEKEVCDAKFIIKILLKLWFKHSSSRNLEILSIILGNQRFLVKNESQEMDISLGQRSTVF